MVKSDLIEQLVSLLAGKGLTMYGISKRTLEMYGRSSAYYLPHNFYSQVRQETFTPSIYQLAALSRISGYRLTDWLKLFGTDIGEIVNLQVRLPSGRTHLLDAGIGLERVVPILKERCPRSGWEEIAPLSRLVSACGRQRLETGPSSGGFLYAKVGYEDALAFPCLAAGSLVRIARKAAMLLLPQEYGTTSKAIFLVEYGNGYLCCRLRRTGVNRFSTVSCRLPYPEIELSLGTQGRILGIVDLEVRSLVRTFPARVPANLQRNWIANLEPTPSNLAQLLKAARRRMNLSLPMASRLSHEVAAYFRDRRYAISISSLCDYEVATDAPRHLQKIVSLCAIYRLEFRAFLLALGIDPESCGREPMPVLFREERRSETEAHSITQELQEDGLSSLKSEFLELAVLLSPSLPHIAGMRKLSLEDFFWTGGNKNPLHPVLQGSIVAIVNRQKKRPPQASEAPCHEPPVFLLLKRDGGYIAGFTTLERGVLTVHGVPQHLHRTIQLRNRDAAEVMGQIVAVMRRMM